MTKNNSKANNTGSNIVTNSIKILKTVHIKKYQHLSDYKYVYVSMCISKPQM